MSKRDEDFVKANKGRILPEGSMRSRKATPIRREFVNDEYMEKFFRDNKQPMLYCSATQDGSKVLMYDELKQKAELIASCFLYTVACIEDLHFAKSFTAAIHDGKKLASVNKAFGLFVTCIEYHGQAILNTRYRNTHGKNASLNASNKDERDPAAEIDFGFRACCQDLIKAFLSENNAETVLAPKTKDFCLEAKGGKLMHSLNSTMNILHGLIFEKNPQGVLAKMQEVHAHLTTVSRMLEGVKRSIDGTPRRQTFPFDMWRLTVLVLRQDDAAIAKVLCGGKIRLIEDHMSASRVKGWFKAPGSARTARVWIYMLGKDVFSVLLRELGKLCSEDLLEHTRKTCAPHLKMLQ